jgi:hypothetical protein
MENYPKVVQQDSELPHMGGRKFCGFFFEKDLRYGRCRINQRVSRERTCHAHAG